MPMGRLGTGLLRRPSASTYLLSGRLRVSMIRLSRQIRRRDPSDLTIAKLSALATVVQSGPLSVGQLAEIEGLPSPAATRLADKLEETGLIARRANPEDRRGIILVATAAGAELLDRRDRIGTAWLAGVSTRSANRTAGRSSAPSPSSRRSPPNAPPRRRS
jgi:DNA-binding MarR family transcriptional regulator